MDKNILILGLGNILMGNEGIGVRAIEFLKDQKIAQNVRLLDGGTGGFHLLSLFQEYSKFIIIDATISDGVFGEINVLQPKFASDFPRTLTSHDIGLRDLMQSAELLGDLPEIHLLTINIKDLNEVGIGISDALEQCLPKIYHTIQGILANMQASTLKP
jgi:hydrogenase maturation protease